MNANDNLAVLDRVVRLAPLGLRFWDVAASTDMVDGLEVDVFPTKQPEQRIRAFVNRSGIYVVAGVPGLRRFELGGDDAATAYAAALRPYRIEVRDPIGRFLPLTFDADLPVRDLFDWLVPGLSPPQHFQLPNEQGSPPPLMVRRIPLFSAPERAVPGPLAVIRAQVLEFGNKPEKGASWCCLTASVDGVIRGIGLADVKGRIALLFPYPDRTRPPRASPPPAVNDFHWAVELKAYYLPKVAPQLPSDPPDLADLIAQFSAQRELFGSTMSPPLSLPELSLEYGVPLTVPKDIKQSVPSSYLFVDPT